ncbi:MAG: nucleotidyltransferase [Bacteroidetes bacterium 4572_77]|nr:MAG: nucleotidyltransferase [Bacteroidetes bacterium 4572_77]
MKAFLFAAGLGTRLQPLTNNCPKALVKVAGKPMLQHLILNLKKAGIEEMYINIHHFGDQIIQFLEDNNNFACNITISDEREELLDTGGGLKKVLNSLSPNEDLLVHNVDIMTSLNINDFISFHQKSPAKVSLLLQKRSTSRYLLFHKEKQSLRGWINTKTLEKIPKQIQENDYHWFAFNGIHIVNSSIRDYLPIEKVFPIIPAYLKIAEHQMIRGMELQEEFWVDMGKIAQIKQAENYLINHKA